MWELPKLSKVFNPATDGDGVSGPASVIPEPQQEQAAVRTTIEETLARHKAPALVREVQRGPTVTRYLLELQSRTKVSQVEGLADDLAVALAIGGASVRFDRAGAVGKPYVAIEVPNSVHENVSLLDLMRQQYVSSSAAPAANHVVQSALKMTLGCDMAGVPVVEDLAKLPHLLIAGATGSGKSVAINSVIAGFLMQYTPEQLQFIMIDPKLVELSTYKGIPHLAFPVVSDIAGPAIRYVPVANEGIISSGEVAQEGLEVAELRRELDTTTAQGCTPVGRIRNAAPLSPAGGARPAQHC